ncbi:MAG: mucoidy inhibitor MuiA family protein [Bacteroidota bacterium]|nr:mucoidy inhibitor MuiA family protein [Bacteroidota bacterium]
MTKYKLATRTLLIALSLITLSVTSYAQGITSVVKEVNVFNTGVFITRTAKVTLIEGVQTLNFVGIGSNVDASSISIRAGVENIQLNNIGYGLNIETGSPSTTLTKAQFIGDSIQQKINYLNNEKQNLEQEIELFQSNYKVPNDLKGNFTDNVEEFADVYRTRVLDVRNKITRISRQIVLLYEIKTRWETDFNILKQQDRSRFGNAIALDLSSPSAVKTEITLQYFDRSAGWSANYDIRAKDLNIKIDITQFANVYQNTGDDWNDVKMTLTSGTPGNYGSLPIFQSSYYDFYTEGKKYRNELSKPEPAMSQRDKKNDLTQGVVYDVEEPLVMEVENALSFGFAMKDKQSVKSNKNAIRIQIASNQSTAKYLYKCIPFLDNNAYLTAEITDWGELNLLPGSANVFLDGILSGKTDINLSNTDDTLTLSLGKDDRVVVQRKEVKNVSKRVLIGTSQKQTKQFIITVKNNKPVPINIQIVDRVPVSRQTEVEIEINDKSGASFDPISGQIVWKTEIKKGDSKKFELSYSVKWPKSKNLSITNY